MTYRIFTNDVARNAYSCLCEVESANPTNAIIKAAKRAQLPGGTKMLAIPKSKPELMPNGKTGKIQIDVFLDYGGVVEYRHR